MAIGSSPTLHGRVALLPLALLALLSLAPPCSCIFSSVGPQQSLKVVKFASGSFFSKLSTVSGEGSSAASNASSKVLAGFPGMTAYEVGEYVGEPPSVAVAVGGGFVVQAVNSAIRVYNATNGKALTAVTPLYKFVNMSAEFIDYISGTTRAYYDPLAKRFFVFIVAAPGYFNSSNVGDFSFQMVAVSKSSDPLKGFHYFRYNADLTESGTLHDQAGGCPCLADFNQAGFDQYGVYISVNTFSGNTFGYVGVTLQAISKQDLIQGKVSPTAVRFDGSPKSYGYLLSGTLYSNTPPSFDKASAISAYTIQPATIPTGGLPDLSNGGVQYFVSNYYPDFSLPVIPESDRRLDVWAMTNTSSLASRSPKLTLSKKTIYVKPYLLGSGFPDAVQKKGYAPLANASGYGVFKLDPGDWRMAQVVFSNGTLMASFSSLYKNAKNASTGISYAMISTSFSSITKQVKAVKLHDGFFSIPGSYVFFPAITFNKHRAMIAFGFSGASYFPSVGAFYVETSKPYKASNYTVVYYGKGPEDGYSGLDEFQGYGVNQWGYYFSACVDEKDNFWLGGATILGKKRNEYTNWGSYIAKVSGV